MDDPNAIIDSIYAVSKHNTTKSLHLLRGDMKEIVKLNKLPMSMNSLLSEKQIRDEYEHRKNLRIAGGSLSNTDISIFKMKKEKERELKSLIQKFNIDVNTEQEVDPV